MRLPFDDFADARDLDEDRRATVDKHLAALRLSPEAERRFEMDKAVRSRLAGADRREGFIRDAVTPLAISPTLAAQLNYKPPKAPQNITENIPATPEDAELASYDQVRR